MTEKVKAPSIPLLDKGGVIAVLLWLYDHPEGLQKIQLRSIIGLSSLTAISVHELLFDSGLIENLPSSKKMLFGLSIRGKKIAALLKSVQYFINPESIDKPILFNRLLEIVRSELIVLSPELVLNVQNLFDLFIEFIEEESLNIHSDFLSSWFEFQKIEAYESYFKYLGIYKSGDNPIYDIIGRYSLHVSLAIPIELKNKYTQIKIESLEDRMKFYQELIEYTKSHWNIPLELRYPKEKIDYLKANKDKIKRDLTGSDINWR
jgi:hypothetical protein